LSLQSAATSLRQQVTDVVGSARSARPALVKRQSSTTNAIYNTRFPNVTWNNDAWQIETTVLDQGHYQSRMSVANGYLGINVAAVGPFFEQDVAVSGDNINGWPLFSQRQTFATIAGFYDQQPTTNGTNFAWLNQYGGESVISGVPHWSGLIVVLSNGAYLSATVDNTTISNFSTMLDMRGGVMTWAYTWSPANANGLSFQIEYTMFAHRYYVNQGVVHLQITPSSDCNVTIANVLDGTSAVRTDFVSSGTDGQAIYTAVKPNGVNTTAYIYAAMQGSTGVDASTLKMVSNAPYLGANGSSIAQTASASLKAGQTTTVTKYVGGASTDAFPNAQGTARNACMSAMKAGYNQSLVLHAAEWAVVFREDSVDDYSFPQNHTLPSDPNIIEQQIVAVVNPYYLLQNTVSADAVHAVGGAPIDTNSIPVGGLGSDSYAGLIFWDAEIWMQPGLVAAFPDAAKQIANYRVVRYRQALANAQTAFTSSKNQTGRFSADAAVFSWTSGRTGNCTGTGPCFDYEYHINGDIAQEFTNYLVVTGDTQFFKNSLFPIYNSIATFYSEVLDKNGSSWVLTNMTDPVSICRK